MARPYEALPRYVQTHGPRAGLGSLFGGRRQDTADRALAEIQAKVRSGCLAEAIHPATGPILEACALHLERIQRHNGAANSAVPAAESAMREAIRICAPYLWRPKRRPVWSKVVKELLEGDLEDALEHAMRQVKSSPAQERLDLEHVPEPLRPAYDIALRLKRLAHEMARNEATVPGPNAIDSLDAALIDLRERRRAEAELDA